MALNGGEAEQMLEAAQQHPDQARTHSVMFSPSTSLLHNGLYAYTDMLLNRTPATHHSCSLSSMMHCLLGVIPARDQVLARNLLYGLRNNTDGDHLCATTLLNRC